MLHCLIKLFDKTKLKHSLVCPAVSVQVPTATTRSSQCGWRPRLSLGRQPIRAIAITETCSDILLCDVCYMRAVLSWRLTDLQ